MLTKKQVHTIVFGTDTRAGYFLDIILLFFILTNVLLVMMERIPPYGNAYPNYFLYVEIVFTIIFTIEYFVRIYISPRPLKYIFSFCGLIDFLSVIPTEIMSRAKNKKKIDWLVNKPKVGCLLL